MRRLSTIRRARVRAPIRIPYARAMSTGERRPAEHERPTEGQSAEKRVAQAGKVTFVTGNAGKLAEVMRQLGPSFPVVAKDVDLPELQGTPTEISRQKCLLAVEQVKGPVIVEDTSLGFDALGGMPGPYVKWFLKAVGLPGLVRLLSGWEDKGAAACCVFSYCDGPGCDVHTFQGVTQGTIVEARGPDGFGWDPIFEEAQSGKTYAEMGKDEKNACSHRGKALAKFAAFWEARSATATKE